MDATGTGADRRRGAERYDVIVIGGGQAGLAVGHHLARRGLRFVILDASPRIGDAWRGRWDSLRLFTPAGYDGLPGMPFPAPRHAFPTKDEMADFLVAYAARFELPVRSGTRVERLSSRDGRYLVATARGEELEGDHVVVAMANYQVPRTPAFAGELSDDIVQLHSREYRNPAQLRDGPVLIVGAGNSGAEIAAELGRDRRVLLSGRHPGQLPFDIGGFLGRLLLGDDPWGWAGRRADRRAHRLRRLRRRPFVFLGARRANHRPLRRRRDGGRRDRRSAAGGARRDGAGVARGRRRRSRRCARGDRVPPVRRPRAGPEGAVRTALALLGTVALLQGCVPGPSVATADLTSDREVDLRWDAARDREYEVWLAFDDVRYDGRLTIDGQLTVETAGAPTARYTTAFDSENNLRAVQERAVVSKRRWVNSRGSLTGYIFAFPIPPQAPGTPIRVAGRLEGPSPRAGRIRLLAVAED